jgi:hypothetical protein
VQLHAAVGREGKSVLSLSIWPWFVFHGGFGAAALWMAMKAAG